MRKILLVIFPALAFMAACGNKSASSEADSANVSADSSINASDSVEADSIDSIPAYYSEDLQKFGLHGSVQTVKTIDYSSFVTCLSGPLSFNDEGTLISKFDELTDNVYTTDNEGYIDNTKCRESDGTEFILELSNFDADGNPLKGTYTTEGPDGVWKVTFTITYDEYDREGNWLKRTFKGEAVTTGYEENSRPQKEPFEAKESRTISYFR